MSPLWPFERTPNEPPPASPAPSPAGPIATPEQTFQNEHGVCECGRPYTQELKNDPGVCCICARDLRMDAQYGADWRAFLERLLPILNGSIWYDAEALTLFYDAKSLLEDLRQHSAPEVPLGASELLVAAIKATRWIGMAVAHNAFADCANPIIAERDLAHLEAAIAKAQEEIR